jgi:rRNA maturation protein Rpf1
LPSLLLTTSRKTSNRVRTFVRDLSSILPGIDRFNRGGMGISELVARISQTGSRAALVISIWQGNPGKMTFLSPNGDETLQLKVESALLRRELSPKGPPRVHAVDRIFIKSGSGEIVRTLAEDLAKILDLEVSAQLSPAEALTNDNQSFIWLEEIGGGKILWTHYTAPAYTEIGPRIRVSSIRRPPLK